ncbi:hypothetical protein HBDW_34610 [Herbaspirillum sp. DW155]|uniref:hypothetical protein n=1 Tax=Herbaspirillum sp. DW155 TaxID=3095609 RepID=UPI00309056AF|nr:hypothetical protein HBDW_34610 [Herbaspirillum sp. DW155]
MNARFTEVSRENFSDMHVPERFEERKNLNIPLEIACEEDLFLGFFFDGTNSNKYRDTPTFASSNVARLYEACFGHLIPLQMRRCEMSVLARISLNLRISV